MIWVHGMPVCGHMKPLPIAFNSLLRLVIQALLQGDPDGFVAWYGVLCSTWSAVSRGSTFRWYLNPLGYEDRECVAQGNLMVARFGG